MGDKLYNWFQQREIPDLTDVFDGNNCTIYNIPVRLFETISEGAVLKNLNIVQTTVSDSTVCQCNEGCIENVTVSASVVQEGESEHSGGLVEVNDGLISKSTFKGSRTPG